MPALTYFFVVFGAGFLLGTARVLVVVPFLGERVAELSEMPLMLGVIVVTARWIVRSRLPDRSPVTALLVGMIAAGFILTADLGIGVLLRGMTASEVFLARDPIAGTAYYVAVLTFALLPWLFSHNR
ncbi:hypothetical protein YTPLAS18_31450 [Nitrospira sp.]|nr:hypothetical protein YTPLAS18_31450 [Nitrospira sp.]